MRVLLGVSIVVAVVAAVDAARGSHWDQFAMLVLLAALSASALAALVRAGRLIRLRPDLMAWVDGHAALSDDEPQRVVNRALAAYRAQMLPDAEEGSVAE